MTNPANGASANPTGGNHKVGTFINSAGESYTVRGMSPTTPENIAMAVTEEWKAAGKALPIIPTYEAILATGEKEIHAHDKTTLVVEGNPEQTAINQANWKAYLDANAEFTGECNARLMKVVFLAVDVHPDDAWREEMEFIGMKLPPKGSAAERYAYVENHVVQNPGDIASLMARVFNVAGMINEAALNAVEATFRSALEEAFAIAGSTVAQTGKLEG